MKCKIILFSSFILFLLLSAIPAAALSVSYSFSYKANYEGFDFDVDTPTWDLPKASMMNAGHKLSGINLNFDGSLHYSVRYSNPFDLNIEAVISEIVANGQRFFIGDEPSRFVFDGDFSNSFDLGELFPADFPTYISANSEFDSRKIGTKVRIDDNLIDNDVALNYFVGEGHLTIGFLQPIFENYWPSNGRLNYNPFSVLPRCSSAGGGTVDCPDKLSGGFLPVGNYLSGDIEGTVTYEYTKMPEPASVGLTVVGLAVLGLIRRRTKLSPRS